MPHSFDIYSCYAFLPFQTEIFKLPRPIAVFLHLQFIPSTIVLMAMFYFQKLNEPWGKTVHLMHFSVHIKACLLFNY